MSLCPQFFCHENHASCKGQRKKAVSHCGYAIITHHGKEGEIEIKQKRRHLPLPFLHMKYNPCKAIGIEKKLAQGKQEYNRLPASQKMFP